MAASREAGLSSMGRHPSPGNRPHVTLLVRPTLPEMPFTEATAQLPIPITLGDPLVFRHGGRAVLARRVTASTALLALQPGRSRGRTAGSGCASHDPSHMGPHVTLARRLPVESLPEALALLGGQRTGTAVSLRRWDSATAMVTAPSGSCPARSAGR